jgi:hypothetical protein
MVPSSQRTQKSKGEGWAEIDPLRILFFLFFYVINEKQLPKGSKLNNKL